MGASGSGQLSPSAVRATQRLATAMPRNLTQLGCARPRGLCATSGTHWACSITSSARTRSDVGNSIPRAFAAFKLSSSSNLDAI
jgi:hypothetical protein